MPVREEGEGEEGALGVIKVNTSDDAEIQSDGAQEKQGRGGGKRCRAQGPARKCVRAGKT